MGHSEMTQLKRQKMEAVGTQSNDSVEETEKMEAVGAQ